MRIWSYHIRAMGGTSWYSCSSPLRRKERLFVLMVIMGLTASFLFSGEPRRTPRPVRGELLVGFATMARSGGFIEGA